MNQRQPARQPQAQQPNEQITDWSFDDLDEAGSDFEPLAANWYDATLIEVVIQDNPGGGIYNTPPHKEIVARWQIDFDDGGEPATLRSWIAIIKTRSTKSWMYKLCTALGVMDADGNWLERSSQRWLGRCCRVNVTEETKTVDGQQRIVNKIKGYAPIPVTPRRGMRQAQPAPDADAVIDGSADAVPFGGDQPATSPRATRRAPSPAGAAPADAFQI